MDGSQARRGYGRNGPETHEGGVQSRQERDTREEQEREAADG